VVREPGNVYKPKGSPSLRLNCNLLCGECKYRRPRVPQNKGLTFRLTTRLARRRYRAEIRLVVYLQSCIRRRYARRELQVLRTEARSASKFKEISYKLENKVVELTQTLQARTQEKKELLNKLSELERQLQVWQSRHEEVDNRAKQLQVDMQTSHVPKPRFDELLLAKQTLDAQLEDSTRRVTAQDEEIKSLTAELERQTQEMEHRQKVAAEEAAAAASKAAENGPTYAALKAELSTLRDQLNRSNALNTLTRSARDPISPGLKAFDTQQNALITPSPSNGSLNGRHLRRHSSAGAYGTDIYNSRDALTVLNDIKRSQNPRAASVAFHGADGIPRFRGNGLGNIYDDPAEEKVKLLEDAQHLDEDVLDGLIRGLKIPMPSLTTPPSIKEVLFPANLIALITNEMWKFGLIPESERFLANVMQTIQAHVMVSTLMIPHPRVLLMIPSSLFLERILSFPVCFGYQMSRSFFPSSALRRATCCKASVLVANRMGAISTGPITSDWFPLSSMTLTV
jgi:myosin V